MDDLLRDIEEALGVLRSGGIILYPTDTIWGLGCDPADEKALERVYTLKRRPAEKSMIMLVDSFAMLERYTSGIPEVVYELCEAATEPLTLVVPARKSMLAPQLVSPDGFIAMRICHEPFCQGLIGKFRKPVVSTSANISGEPPPAVFTEIAGEIINGVDFVVNYRRSDPVRAKPSAVIKIDTKGVITILRK